MALTISTHCIGCYACKLVCPQKAIVNSGSTFQISHRCDECASQPFGFQCAAICPAENAICTAEGKAINPTDSLRPSAATLEKLKALQELLL